MLKHEGGFVNNEHDLRGMTNLGVTRKTWVCFNGKTIEQVSEIKMRDLTPD